MLESRRRVINCDDGCFRFIHSSLIMGNKALLIGLQYASLGIKEGSLELPGAVNDPFKLQKVLVGGCFCI